MSLQAIIRNGSNKKILNLLRYRGCIRKTKLRTTTKSFEVGAICLEVAVFLSVKNGIRYKYVKSGMGYV